MCAWWTKTNDELQRALRSREDLVEEDVLGQNGAFYGPDANDVKDAFPDLFGDVKLTDKPWEKGADKAGGIGPNNTYWVLDPKNIYKGVWILDSTSEEAARNAQAAQAMTQYGFYRRVSEAIPPIAEIKAARPHGNGLGLTFQTGFTEGYYRYHPEQDPRKKASPTAPKIAVRTFELFAMLDGVNVPLSEALTYDGAAYALVPGAELAVGDSEGDGFGLAGTPGAWPRYYGTQSPAGSGLDADKAVLAWDGSRGWVVPGRTLRDLFGPQWRATIYG